MSADNQMQARRRPPRCGRAPTSRGVTLVELLVGIAIVGILLALAVPSFTDMIARQRVRGVNAELVTDLQYARTEAVRRATMSGTGVSIWFHSNASTSCYSLFVKPGIGACDCLRPAASRCLAPAAEIKTVQLMPADGITFSATPADSTWYPNQRGTVIPIAITVASARSGQLKTSVSQAGRVQVCSPDGSISGVPVCAPPPSP